MTCHGFRPSFLALLLIIGGPVHGRAQVDSSRHHVQRIAVDRDVRLEVLDWGGAGRPVVLLAGGEKTAHDFDRFGPVLAAHYRVYGITRRGIGASSRPDSGYEADRLGDDVLAVIDSLRLIKPVLVGSSRAGEELSSIGSRQPTRVAGLVYLDAGFYYAYYDSTRGNLGLEILDLSRKLDRLQWGPIGDYRELQALIRELADVSLPRVERHLRDWQRAVDSVGDRIPLPSHDRGSVIQKIWAGSQMYTHIDAPLLAIYAAPHRETPPEMRAIDSTSAVDLANGFKRVVPSARIVFLRDANHLLWESHEADVLREMRVFIDGLPEADKK